MNLKKFLPISGCLLSILAPGFSKETYCCREDYSLNHHVALYVDWLYLRRSEIDNQTLVKNMNTNKTVMDTKGVFHNFNWESAIRAGLSYLKDEKTTLEGVYLYIFPWEGKKRVTGSSDLRFPFSDPSYSHDFINASEASAKYFSWVQNAELNYWGHLTPRRINYFSVSWLLGGRFLYLKEKFNIEFTRPPDKSQYRIQTKNLLYGLQLGGVFEINPSRKWTWTVLLKGAGFLNDAKNDVFLGDFNDTVTLRNFKKKRYAASFLVEGLGSLSYQWASYMNIHVGYQALLVTGLALAAEQRDRKASSRRHMTTSGHMVIDGIYAGLTFSF